MQHIKLHVSFLSVGYQPVLYETVPISKSRCFFLLGKYISTTDISWAKCESFGCVGLQTNNSSDKNEIDKFNKIKSLLSKSKKIEMKIPTFAENPISIPADLDGYDQASKKMFAEEIF